MRIDPLRTRTTTNPTLGITYHLDDKEKIARNAEALANVDANLIMAMRYALARQIIHLFEIGDWTSPGTEQDDERVLQLKNALIAYEATYGAKLAQIYASTHPAAAGPAEGTKLQ